MAINPKTIKRILAAIVIGGVGWLFANSLIDNWANIKNQDIQLLPEGLVILALFTVAVVSTGYLWGKVLADLTAEKIDQKEAVRVQLASWLLKYIPGQAGSFIYKVNWATKVGIAKNKVIMSFFYENLFLTIASTVPTIPILLLELGNRSKYNLSVILLVLVLLPVIISRRFFIAKAEKLLGKITKSPVKLSYLSLAKLLKYSFLFMIPRLINAAGFVVITGSFLHITPDMYLTLGATYVLAGIIGIYAIFVPSGLGVREGVITVFLTAYFPFHQAAALALIARFYATLADLLVALVFAYLTKTKSRRA